LTRQCRGWILDGVFAPLHLGKEKPFMMRTRVALAFAAALWAAVGLGAADLQKIERVIAKEPA
jgi:hypothetical protein